MKQTEPISPSSPLPNCPATMSSPKFAKSFSSRIESKGFPIISKIIYSQGKLAHSRMPRSPIARKDIMIFKKYSELFEQCQKEADEQEVKELHHFFLQKRRMQFKFIEDELSNVEDKVNLVRAQVRQGNMKKVKCERKETITKLCFRSRRGATSFPVFADDQKFIRMPEDLRRKIQQHTQDDDQDTDSDQCTKGIQRAFAHLVQAVRSSSMRVLTMTKTQQPTRSRSVYNSKRDDVSIRLSESLIN